MLVSHTKGELTLAERKIKNVNMETRFSRADVFTKNILASELLTEQE